MTIWQYRRLQTLQQSPSGIDSIIYVTYRAKHFVNSLFNWFIFCLMGCSVTILAYLDPVQLERLWCFCAKVSVLLLVWSKLKGSHLGFLDWQIKRGGGKGGVWSHNWLLSGAALFPAIIHGIIALEHDDCLLINLHFSFIRRALKQPNYSLTLSAGNFFNFQKHHLEHNYAITLKADGTARGFVRAVPTCDIPNNMGIMKGCALYSNIKSHCMNLASGMWQICN